MQAAVVDQGNAQGAPRHVFSPLARAAYNIVRTDGKYAGRSLLDIGGRFGQDGLDDILFTAHLRLDVEGVAARVLVEDLLGTEVFSFRTLDQELLGLAVLAPATARNHAEAA